MNETVFQELMKLHETKTENDLVFVNPKTKKGYVCIRNTIKRACKRAEIDNLMLPDLRRTFATRLLSAGADII